MSESLKECEHEIWDGDGNHVARGRWKCSKDGEEIKWESKVERRLIEEVDKVSGPVVAGKFIDDEHRAFREAVAKEIEKHIGEH